MKVLSVCTNLPTEAEPNRGLFVAERLKQIANLVDLQALLPVPCFPWLRPWTEDMPLDYGFQIDRRPMPYIPKFTKYRDGQRAEKCITKWLAEFDRTTLNDCILDAHFGYPEGVGCVRAARERNLPVFVTIRGLESELFNTPHIGHQLANSLREANGVVSVSESLRELAINAGVPAANICVIPNGIDTKRFRPRDRTKARDDLNINPATSLVVCVANAKRVKGHDILLHALAKLPQISDLRVVCIGRKATGPWNQTLKSSMRHICPNITIQFIGEQPPEAVANWLNACDLFTIASRREGCCNAILEALACGTPVVATNVGDNANYVTRRNGVLVPPDSPHALAAALELALNTEYNHHEIAETQANNTWLLAAQRAIQFMRSRL